MSTVTAWFLGEPVFTRSYILAIIVVLLLTFSNVLPASYLFFVPSLIIDEFHFWRLFTPSLFFGSFSIMWVMFVYMLYRNIRMMETVHFIGRFKNFIYFMLSILFLVELLYFGLCFLFPFQYPLQKPYPSIGQIFLLTFEYLVCRHPDNANRQMTFFGIFGYPYPYHPAIMAVVYFLMGTPFIDCIIPIILGHILYFFMIIFPCEKLGGRDILHFINMNAPAPRVEETQPADRGWGPGRRLE